MMRITSKLLVALSIFFCFLTYGYAAPLKNKNIIVDIDFMHGLEFARPAGQIILGNPVIADITVRDDEYIFISGKSPGRTNMLVYGRDGKISEQFTLVVRDPSAYLTLYKGANDRANFDCEPLCQRVLRIEDRGNAAEEQRARIQAQIQMIDGRAQNSRSEELIQQQSQ